jgi:nanoRNase/pAp phosphatase (c-di-AMP/oligoRNAs hydrolase)
LYQLGKEIINLDKWKELVCATMIMEFSYTRDENFEFIKRIYPYITKKDIYNSVPGELSADISSALTYLKGDVKKVYDLILRGNMEELREYRVIIDEETKKYTNKYIKEAEFFPEKNLYFYYTTPELDVSSAVATILSLREKDKTFIFVSDIKGEKGYVKVSSRNQSGNVDLNSLLKKGIERLENATAGGHAKASGARFMKRDIDKFKENLLK